MSLDYELAEDLQEVFESEAQPVKMDTMPRKGRVAEIFRRNEMEKTEDAIKKHIHDLESTPDPKEKQDRLDQYWKWVREGVEGRYLPSTEIEDFESKQTENTVTVIHKPSQFSSTFTGAKDQHENEKQAYETIWGILEDHIDAWKNKVSKKFRQKYGVIVSSR